MGLNVWYLFEAIKVLVLFSLTRRMDNPNRWTSEVVLSGPDGWKVRGHTRTRPGQFWDEYITSRNGPPEFGYALQHTPITQCMREDDGTWYDAHHVMAVVLCYGSDVDADTRGNYTLIGRPVDWDKAKNIRVDWDKEKCAFLGTRMTLCLDGEGDGTLRDWYLGYTGRWVSPAILQAFKDCGITCIKQPDDKPA